MKSFRKKYYILFLVLLNCFYFVSHNISASCIENENIRKENFISQIEKNFYVNDLEYSNIVEFKNNKWQPVRNLRIPSNQIFKLFKFRDAVRVTADDISGYTRFYKGYLDGEYSLYDLLIRSWNPGIYGVIVMTQADESQCATLNKFYNNNDLSILLENYPKREAENILDVLSRESVWTQLKNSNLDLMNTNVMAIQGFDWLTPCWGVLFYDNINEYYMSLYDYKYEQIGIGSEYILPEEKASFTLSAYRLYDVKAELAPFLYNMHLLDLRIGQRMACKSDRETS